MPEPTPISRGKRKKLVIAIDGPAGAGKSTIASRWRALWLYQYRDWRDVRALGLKAITSDVSVDDEDALLRLADKSNIELEPTTDGNGAARWAECFATHS